MNTYLMSQSGDASEENKARRLQSKEAENEDSSDTRTPWGNI